MICIYIYTGIYIPTVYVSTISRLNTYIYNRKKEINSEPALSVLFLFYLDDSFLLLFQQLFRNYFFLTLKSHTQKSLFQQHVFQPNIEVKESICHEDVRL